MSLYGDLLSYYPQIKFLGITFDKRMTFTKHFEEILEHCNQKFHRLRILVNKSGVQVPRPCARSKFLGVAGRRTSHGPPSLPPPLIFKAKFKIFCHPTLLKIRFKITVTPLNNGQSQNYGVSINSNGLLTL